MQFELGTCRNSLSFLKRVVQQHDMWGVEITTVLCQEHGLPGTVKRLKSNLATHENGSAYCTRTPCKSSCHIGGKSAPCNMLWSGNHIQCILVVDWVAQVVQVDWVEKVHLHHARVVCHSDLVVSWLTSYHQ